MDDGRCPPQPNRLVGNPSRRRTELDRPVTVRRGIRVAAMHGCPNFPVGHLDPGVERNVERILVDGRGQPSQQMPVDRPFDGPGTVTRIVSEPNDLVSQRVGEPQPQRAETDAVSLLQQLQLAPGDLLERLLLQGHERNDAIHAVEQFGPDELADLVDEVLLGPIHH